MCAVVLLVEEEAAMLMCTLWVLVGIAVVRAARKVVSGRVSFMVAWLVRGVLWRWLVVRGLEVTGRWWAGWILLRRSDALEGMIGYSRDSRMLLRRQSDALEE
jgi:hypothetical protein